MQEDKARKQREDLLAGKSADAKLKRDTPVKASPAKLETGIPTPTRVPTVRSSGAPSTPSSATTSTPTKTSVAPNVQGIFLFMYVVAGRCRSPSHLSAACALLLLLLIDIEYS